MEINFNQQRALVTGAGKGIGRDLVKKLVEYGATVYAISRTKSDLNSLAKECPGVHVITCDLGDWDATEKAVKSCGDIDLLVNNAAIAICQPFLEATAEVFDRSFAVNVRSMLQVSQIVARNMIARKSGGSIVNLSSQASQVGLADHAVYCASKAAVDSLTATMGLELGPHNIRVNAVNPTVVNTEMGKVGWSDPVKASKMRAKIPLGRFAEVEDVVNVILFLLSDKAAMVNAVTLPIDGGFLATG